jgi:hypothetical protein
MRATSLTRVNPAGAMRLVTRYPSVRPAEDTAVRANFTRDAAFCLDIDERQTVPYNNLLAEKTFQP